MVNIGSLTAKGYNDGIDKTGGSAFIITLSGAFNDYGEKVLTDVSETGSYATKAIMLPIGNDEQQYLEQGLVTMSDKKMFFKTTDVGSVFSGNRIEYDSQDYVVIEKQVGQMNGIDMYHKVLVRREDK